MGLDMYLYRKSYVKNWDHYGPEQRHEITIKKGCDVRSDIKPKRITHIVEEVAYWRKANAIHRWFVEHVQHGKDECQESTVEVEQLRELVGLCKQVLATIETIEDDVADGTTYYPDGKVVNHSHKGPVVAQKHIAKTMLPTQSGFFFGNTDYDERYLLDLKDTIEQIEPLLDDEDSEFTYHASW